MINRLLTSAALATLLVMPAQAHFQSVYSPDANLDVPGAVPLKLLFWHPGDNGHVMDMGTPQELFYVFRGERTDLTDTLSPITFKGSANEGAGYAATLPVRRNGDYIVGLVPEPYYEEAEDIYIQQLTKVYFNKGGIPTGWNEPLGLATEIVPLNKPNNVVVGSTFSGQVVADGEPVAGAEIEIEFMPVEPDMENNTAGEGTLEEQPGGSIVAITDADGVFTFGIPRAGQWGFAALGSGPVTEHEGKELSQDAVIWITAYDMAQ